MPGSSMSVRKDKYKETRPGKHGMNPCNIVMMAPGGSKRQKLSAEVKLKRTH